MWLWVLLEGTNLFGGTETMWARSCDLYGTTKEKYFNARSEYYCPIVKYVAE
jgi:hypothetical protein